MDDCTDCAPIPVVSVNTPFIFFLQQYCVKLFPIKLIFISEQMLSPIKVWASPVFGNSEFEPQQVLISILCFGNEGEVWTYSIYHQGTNFLSNSVMGSSHLLSLFQSSSIKDILAQWPFYERYSFSNMKFKRVSLFCVTRLIVLSNFLCFFIQLV